MCVNMNHKQTPEMMAAEALRETRKAAALTQLQLSQRLHVPEIRVSRWETGRSPITRSEGEAIAKEFDKILAVIESKRDNPLRPASFFEASYRKDDFLDKVKATHNYPQSWGGGEES